MGPKASDAVAGLRRAQPGGGEHLQPETTGGLGGRGRPYPEAASGRTIGAADDEEGGGPGRQSFKKRHAERTAPQEDEPTQH